LRWACALAVVIVVSACGDERPSRDESGQVTEPQQVSIFHLQTGDCFNDPEADQLPNPEVLEVVPCAEPHDTEIYYSFTLAEGAMPDAAAMRQLGADQCFPAFDSFVGIPFELSDLDVFPLMPTAEQWEQRDHRTVHCVLFNLDLSELVGSASGTAR